MAAHTYWRINITAAPTGYAGVAEFKLFDSGGSPIATTGGTASASTNYPGQAPSLAFDGNASTFWLTNGGAPHWLQYQFASAVDVASISLQNAAAGSGNDQHTPQDFTLDYSDNGTTWTTLYTYRGAGWGSGGRTITFNAANAAPATIAISWRLLITGTAGSTVAITEWKLFDASSAQIATTTYSATATSTYTGQALCPYLAFDGLIGTYWDSNAAPSGGAPQSLQYDFGGPAYCASISIQTRNDGNYNQGPTTFKVQYSLNGTTWIDAGTYTASTWTSAGQIQTFTGVVPPTPPATARGNIDYDQVQAAARQGTGAKFQMTTGTVTTGHQAVYDANGNVIDGGSAPTAPLAPATATSLGGVKIGSGVTVASDGTITVPGAPMTWG